MIEILNPQELKDKQETYNYVLVKIFSDTCIPCKQLGSILDELEPQYSHITFLEMNGANNRDWCISNNIRTVPHLILFDKETGTSYSLSGMASKDKVIDFLKVLENSNQEA